MACKNGFCQEEGDGDSDATCFHSDPLLLFLLGVMVSLVVRVHGAEATCSPNPLSFSSFLTLKLISPTDPDVFF